MSGARSSSADIDFVDATCRYAPDDPPAVDGLDLHIADGEFMVLVGPSGSGKSTALRMLAGLEEATSGEIRIGGADVTDMPPRDRDVAMVFQNYALYPNLSVADNMGFALRLAKVPKVERRRRVAEVARTLELEDVLERKPAQLSGGQRQRVAMGRAIVREPKAFLMDEPLSNLDAKLRVQTRKEIARLQRRLGTTTVYVTHDQVEAMTMGERVAVLRDGVLQQVDTPGQLYAEPANAFVAGFIGSPAMNLFETELASGDAGATVGAVVLPLSATALAAASRAGCRKVLLGVRPEVVRVVAEAMPGPVGIAVSVAMIEKLGADTLLHCEVGASSNGTSAVGAEAIELVIRVEGRSVADIGDRFTATIDPAELHVFDPATGQKLA